MAIEITNQIKRIARIINQMGGQMVIVGGAIRDDIMGIPCMDTDIMVQGITSEQMQQAVAQVTGQTPQRVIGHSPVFMAIIEGEGVEIAMARREIKVGEGKHGFQFDSHPSVTVQDDMVRRDFTMGAIAEDVSTGERIDPFGGEQDINDGIIRAIAETFKQSPERVMRMATFAARFDFQVEPRTIQMAQEMKSDFTFIPVEQIWRHFEKMAMQAIKPSRWMEVMVETQWVEFFPEVQPTQEVMNEMDKAVGKNEQLAWIVAAIIHPMNSQERNSFFQRINAPGRIQRRASEFAQWGGDKPARIIQGGMVIRQFGIAPGPQVGEIVRAAFEAQVAGEFDSVESGIAWIAGQI